MKKGRAPVIVDVLFSLEWYLLVVSAIVPFLYFGMNNDPLPLVLKMLLCAAAYVLVALAMRTEKFTALRLIVPVLALAGCVLMGNSLLEYVVLGAVGTMAVACGLVIYFYLQQGCTAYSGMYFLIAIMILASVFAQMLEMPAERGTAAFTLVGVFSAIYLPLCVLSSLLIRMQDSLSIFKGRTEQPVSDIKKRVGKVIAVSTGLVLVLLLVLPQFGGGSLLSTLFAGTYYLSLSGFATLFAALARPKEFGGIEDQVVESPEGLLPPLEEASWQTWLGFAFVLAAFTPLFIWLIGVIYRFLRDSILTMLGKSVSVKQRFNAKYDTVEKLEATAQKKEDRRAAKTNAAKVRRIYRKRITSILGKDKNLRGSLTPAEITRLCSKKGTDVTELTKLYHKARYTQECTDEDVKAAQKL